MSSPAVTVSTAATTLTGNTETAVVTSGAVPVNAPGGQGIQVTVTAAGTTGASVTACTLRIRAGAGTGGAVIGAAMTELQGAAAGFTMNAVVLDTSLGTGAAPSGTAQYTATVQQVGATGNGTMALASISIETANAAGT